MELNKAIAERVSGLLKEKGVAIEELAVKTGLPEKTIKGILANRYQKVGLHRVFIISYSLGLSLQDFFADKIFDNVE